MPRGKTLGQIHEQLMRMKIYAIEIAEAILFLAFLFVWVAKELKNLF